MGNGPTLALPLPYPTLPYPLPLPSRVFAITALLPLLVAFIAFQLDEKRVELAARVRLG